MFQCSSIFLQSLYYTFLNYIIFTDKSFKLRMMFIDQFFKISSNILDQIEIQRN